MNGIINSKELKFSVSYYSKPFSADVGSIQIFCRISGRLMDNLTKSLYTEPLSYKCNLKLNRRWIFSSFCYDMHAYQINECLS
jgi:hypothetical protein